MEQLFSSRIAETAALKQRDHCCRTVGSRSKQVDKDFGFSLRVGLDFLYQVRCDEQTAAFAADRQKPERLPETLI